MAMPGTWDLFNYPGIRSDSDMFTFGFVWKPWLSSYVISPKKEILEYLNEAVNENGLRSKISFGANVERASFSSTTCLWSIEYKDASGETTVMVSGGRAKR